VTTNQDLDGTLRKVQALIAKADGTTNEHEADAYRSKAEALMFKYRIDESMLAASSTTTKGNLVPVWRTIRVYQPGSEFSTTYRFLLSSALSHVDCRGRYKPGLAVDEDGNHWIECDAVGYESDLRYAEMLFTSFALAFAGKMEPKRNPTLSDQENAYLMRSAGMEGWAIARALWLDPNTHPRDISKALRSKARKLFAKESEARGEDPSVLLGQGNSVAVYRESYADGFQQETWSRLLRMRQHNVDEGGAALVLKSRKDAVIEAWYERFPDLRPGSSPRSNVLGGRDTCAKCKAAKSGYCRDHAWLRPRASDYRVKRVNGAGYDRGRTAAQSVDIGGSAGRSTPTSTPRHEIGG
jgi:hypothetical protein